ncbi:MAG: SDR family oxidoreductase [bacterium]
MIVLVTGGTGFIGSNLSQLLLSQGYHVRVLKRHSSSLLALDGLEVELFNGDILDQDSLLPALKGCDIVFHTAAVVSFHTADREKMFNSNVLGTRNLVQASLRAGISKFVHTSSVAALGHPTLGHSADETCTFDLNHYNNGYRLSKYCSEAEIYHGIKQGLQAVIVNPAVVIGPGDIHFHGGQLIRDIYKKRLFLAPSGGTNMVSVKDVAKGHLQAARNGRVGERYILSGENMTHSRIFSITAEIVGGIKPLFTIPQSVIMAAGHISETTARLMNRKPWLSIDLARAAGCFHYYNCTKAASELGYSCSPIYDAIQEAFHWYRNNKLF